MIIIYPYIANPTLRAPKLVMRFIQRLSINLTFSQRFQLNQLRKIHNRIELRPYQQECIDSCIHHYFEQGFKRLMVSLPVGSGKTVVMTQLISKIPDPTPEKHKVLILAHREELLNQIENQLTHFNPDWKIKTDLKFKNNENYDIILGSVQSLGRKNNVKLKNLNLNEFKLIIIDEAHHANASTYLNILNHFQLVEGDIPNNKDVPLLWGCTATVKRHDAKGLHPIFDKIAYHLNWSDMVKQGWLCPPKPKLISTRQQIKKVSNFMGDFNLKQLSNEVNNPLRNQIIVDYYLKNCSDRSCTLVFACDLNHVDALKDTFLASGILAESISGKTNPKLRAQLVQDMRLGKIPVMINCGIMTEGTDIPMIDCIIMARPTQSTPLYMQMLGRGMRCHPSKSDCLVLDFVDNYKNKTLVCTTPNLLGWTEQTSKQQFQQRFKDFQHTLHSSSKTNALFQFYEFTKNELIQWDSNIQNQFNIQHTSLNQFLTHSDLNWLSNNQFHYYLNITNGLIKIDLNDEGDFVSYMQFRIPSPTLHRKIFSSYIPLPVKTKHLTSTMLLTEIYLLRFYPKKYRYALKDAPWRRQQPTRHQLTSVSNYLAKHQEVIRKILLVDGIDNDKAFKQYIQTQLKHKFRKGTLNDFIFLIKLNGLKLIFNNIE